MKKRLYKDLEDIILTLDLGSIPDVRKPVLESAIDYIRTKRAKGDAVKLNFICTHNSRRSHFAQIWAQTMAAFYELDKIFCYSGGTEATALFPKVVETLENQGFQIDTAEKGKNPAYEISFSDNYPPVIGFSKTYDDPFNPKSGFAAVMTCSHADENCPFVAGCDTRIALTYEDPKLFDHTQQQAEKYRERSLQIATEMKYIFSNIN